MEVPSNNGRKDDGLEMSSGSTTRIGVEPVFDDRRDGDIVDSLPTYPSGNSSAAGAVANFLNSIVGAGIVGLPYALAQVSAFVLGCTSLCAIERTWKDRRLSARNIGGRTYFLDVLFRCCTSSCTYLPGHRFMGGPTASKRVQHSVPLR